MYHYKGRARDTENDFSYFRMNVIRPQEPQYTPPAGIFDTPVAAVEVTIRTNDARRVVEVVAVRRAKPPDLFG